MPLRILLADDHRIVRQGLRALLEREGFEIAAEAADGLEAIRLARSTRPDAAVLDLMMPNLNGLDAGREMLRSGSCTAIVVLTMRTENYEVAPALRSGIRAYLLKTQASEDLVHAIRQVVDGRIFLGTGVSGVVIDGYLSGRKAPADLLAPRERQVLQLVGEGRSSKQIAVLLGLSVKTAECYRAHLMERLDIHDTAGLVRYAVRQGLVAP